MYPEQLYVFKACQQLVDELRKDNKWRPVLPQNNKSPSLQEIFDRNKMLAKIKSNILEINKRKEQETITFKNNE